ncbi:MAG: hypothetical protein IKI93_08670 [Clostridia bacterium]|nr:hypothetical protein [Clostridia bacterium]
MASNICPQQRAKNGENARKTAISGDGAWAWFCHLIATGWARYAIPFWTQFFIDFFEKQAPLLYYTSDYYT